MPPDQYPTVVLSLYLMDPCYNLSSLVDFITVIQVQCLFYLPARLNAWNFPKMCNINGWSDMSVLTGFYCTFWRGLDDLVGCKKECIHELGHSNFQELNSGPLVPKAWIIPLYQMRNLSLFLNLVDLCLINYTNHRWHYNCPPVLVLVMNAFISCCFEMSKDVWSQSDLLVLFGFDCSLDVCMTWVGFPDMISKIKNWHQRGHSENQTLDPSHPKLKSCH